jgi:hypothetical protein
MIRTVKLRGVKYKLSITDQMPDGEHGSIDEPEYENPVMMIRKSLTGKVLFETEVHEALHGVFPYLKEEEIDKGAADLVTYLWRRGYKLCDCTAGKPVNQEIETEEKRDGIEYCKGKTGVGMGGGLPRKQPDRIDGDTTKQDTGGTCPEAGGCAPVVRG